MSSCWLCEWAVEVGWTFSTSCSPAQLFLVSDNTCSESWPVISTQTDKHYSELGNASVSSDSLFLNNRFRGVRFLIKKCKSALVWNLDMIVNIFTSNSREWSGFFYWSESKFAIRGSWNDWFFIHCLFSGKFKFDFIDLAVTERWPFIPW